jgi:type I restriction enzyme M protein
MSSEEYMYVILGILSLKYISDRYDVGISNLGRDGLKVDEIDKNTFYYEYKAFIVPKESQWKYLMQFATTNQIGEKIDNAFIKLEQKNDILKGVFDKNYNREGIDQIKLGEVIRIFSDKDFSKDEHEDIIGRIYEYFLGKFFKDRGQKGGEFYTPTSIVQLIVNILKPMSGTIYDPACGTGGMLVQSKRYIESHNGNILDIMVYGQEYNNVTWKLAKLNLILNNFPISDLDGNDVLGNMSADTFINDQHRDKKFDFIMANPPFNLKS